MNKRLQRDALIADLAGVEAFIAAFPKNDPIGRYMFERRADELRAKLAELGRQADTLASVALIFGGTPVSGSRTISTQFAAKALSSYQDLVSKKLASTETGGLARRGPVPVKKASDLHISNVVHGSFGFLLEENDPDGVPLFASSLKEAIQEVSVAIDAAATADEATFGHLVDEMDERVFSALRTFFHALHEDGAVLRLVEGETDHRLDAASVERAFRRVDEIQITSEESEVHGMILGVLPVSGTFEFELHPSKEVVKGRVGPQFSREYLQKIENDENVIKKPTRATLYTKITQRHGGRPQRKNILVDFTVLAAGFPDAP